MRKQPDQDKQWQIQQVNWISYFALRAILILLRILEFAPAKTIDD